MKLNTPIRFVICFGATFCAPVAGAFFTTRESIAGWYASLNKPFFTPPDWLFGPVWTILYVVMALSAFLVWQKDIRLRTVRIALLLYFTQLALNALWTPIFFWSQMPLLAFIEIAVLWVVIGLTLLAFARVSTFAALLLAPYLLWTTFAAILNAGIFLLNLPT